MATMDICVKRNAYGRQLGSFSTEAPFASVGDIPMTFIRSAIPMVEAGPGFAYMAPGLELREIWKDKMTNAVSGAELLSGWLPVYSQDTIDELEPLLRERVKRPSGENA